jgi:phosphatidylglycerophosphate synthase
MIVAKQVADLITTLRALIALILIWVGEAFGAEGLPLAVWLMLADWVGDALDGPIARRSRVQYDSWIGSHDLEVDMTVSVGLLVYLLLAGYLEIWLGAAYFGLWGLGFWLHRGIPRSYGMLFQTPIYAWFIYIAIRDAPEVAWLIPVFIVSVIVLTWPRFPKMVIPGFLAGLQKKNSQ